MFRISIAYFPLQFKFDAKTSRGAIKVKPTYFIKIFEEQNPQIFGIGECSTLEGLSIDYLPNYEQILINLCKEFTNAISPKKFFIQGDFEKYPSILFGIETAWKDFLNGGKRLIVPTDFSSGNKPIDINGLIWMGDKEFMFNQLKEKIQQGYQCIKLKIGGINFEEECSLLEYIRKNFNSSQITLRLDANGAFSPDEALEKLKQLSQYQIHSIEQPIKAQQLDKMREICLKSPIPIALDEELIGIQRIKEKKELLNFIKPQYIILKPSLLGGFIACQEWIYLCDNQKIEYWFTSALESNIGLNAISQMAAYFPISIPQGLGTGQLYHQNIPSPLEVKDGKLWYQINQNWDFSMINWKNI
jgi:o-succinylbenzoate synthase